MPGYVTAFDFSTRVPFGWHVWVMITAVIVRGADLASPVNATRPTNAANTTATERQSSSTTRTGSCSGRRAMP